MNKKNIQNNIKEEFREFRDKNLLRQYYVRYDFPDKQQKIYEFWKTVLKFIFKSENLIIISMNQCSKILQFYEMIPKAFQNIFPKLIEQGILSQKQTFIDQYVNNKKIKTEKGIIKSMLGYFFKPQTTTKIEDKLIFKQNTEIIIQNVKKHMQQILKNQEVIHEHKFHEILQNKFYLYNEDKKFVIEILESLNIITIMQFEMDNNAKNKVLLSGQFKNSNPDLINIKKIKFRLREKIAAIQKKVEFEYHSISELLVKIKQLIYNNDKVTAKYYFSEKRAKQVFLGKLVTRKHTLQNSLHQLEQTENNFDTIESLQMTQQIIKSKQIQNDKLADIKLDSEQILKNLNEVNDFYKSMNNGEQQQDEDQLMDKFMKEVLAEEKQMQVQPPKKSIRIIKKNQIGETNKMQVQTKEQLLQDS